MLVRLLFIALISGGLTGCFSAKSKPENVVIIDRSSNQKNINRNRFYSAEPKLKKSIPVAGKIIQKFSKKHQGLTFDTKPNQAVRSIRDGLVVYSSDKIKNHGNMVIIKHPFGFRSAYLYNQTLKVQAGDKVKQGQIIAITGKRNFYFEMKKFKSLINPINYLR
ncbi:Lipoprotein NlpD [uncultured Candidatus Thioglobus sp.]|nr:Lipoprotein NlpD [uncultured Candidatus Thioglobus sp.]